jgi:hypothetical protein
MGMVGRFKFDSRKGRGGGPDLGRETWCSDMLKGKMPREVFWEFITEAGD